MDIKKVRAFALVAEYKSFSKAAVHLSVSQSLLSKHIAELETQLNVRLFYRNGRGALLTREGEKLLVYARRLDKLIDETISAVKELKSEPSGTVIIGVSSAIGATLTIPLITATKKSFPQINLNIVEALSGHVHEWLNTGRIDVAVIFDTSRSAYVLHEDLVTEELLLVSPPGSAPLSNASIASQISGTDLQSIPLILPSRAHKLRILFDEYTEALGFHVDPIMEIDALIPLIQSVKSGLGSTILPYGAVRDDALIQRVQLTRIGNPALHRKILLATSTERIPTTASRAICDLIKAETSRLDTLGMWQVNDATMKELHRATPAH